MAKRVFATSRKSHLKKYHFISLKTLVLQSHSHPLPHKWIETCITSVKNWAHGNHYNYLFLGDELFDYVNKEILYKTSVQPVIASDLARIIALQHYLTNEFERVIWFDADFLIFAPKSFSLPKEQYSLGREVWIQHNNQGKLVAYKKVHNAFMMFQRGNTFLDFYVDSATRLLLRNTGDIPPQFIGPKLLTAIHNIVQCPVLETAGMLSPLVIHDITNRGGSALELFKKHSTQTIAAANLCSSLCENTTSNLSTIEKCIRSLLLNQSV